MKVLQLTFLTLFCLPIVSKAQTQDEEKGNILKVISLYLRVTDYKDSSAIGKSFHPNAKLMSVTKTGELKEMAQTEWWARISKISNPVVRKSKLTILDISGITASVKVEFETSSDIITLLKFDNGWRIVNKTLSVAL
jgi:hypothetical protein